MHWHVQKWQSLNSLQEEENVNTPNAATEKKCDNMKGKQSRLAFKKVNTVHRNWIKSISSTCIDHVCLCTWSFAIQNFEIKETVKKKSLYLTSNLVFQVHNLIFM